MFSSGVGGRKSLRCLDLCGFFCHFFPFALTHSLTQLPGVLPCEAPASSSRCWGEIEPPPQPLADNLLHLQMCQWCLYCLFCCRQEESLCRFVFAVQICSLLSVTELKIHVLLIGPRRLSCVLQVSDGDRHLAALFKDRTHTWPAGAELEQQRVQRVSRSCGVVPTERRDIESGAVNDSHIPPDRYMNQSVLRRQNHSWLQ